MCCMAHSTRWNLLINNKERLDSVILAEKSSSSEEEEISVLSVASQPFMMMG
jgi:hypothetical protein